MRPVVLESIDAVVVATGYRPHVPCHHGIGALGARAEPLHRRGLSTTHPGVVLAASTARTAVRG